MFCRGCLFVKRSSLPSLWRFYGSPETVLLCQALHPVSLLQELTQLWRHSSVAARCRSSSRKMPMLGEGGGGWRLLLLSERTHPASSHIPSVDLLTSPPLVFFGPIPLWSWMCRVRAGHSQGDKCSHNDLQGCEPELTEMCVHAGVVPGVSQEWGAWPMNRSCFEKTQLVRNAAMKGGESKLIGRSH